MNFLAQLTPSDLGKSYYTYISTSLDKFFRWGLAAIVLILVLILVFQFLKIVRHRRWPRLLFYDLALMHRLSRSTQRRLVHIASTHKIGDPARLFVCPDLVARIESLEISQAAHEKERKRLEEFFAQFKSAAFGEAPSDAISGKGGSE